MSGYEDDRSWSDRFLPQIRNIVGPYLLVPAPLEADRREASDLIIMHTRDLRVAARVRRPGYAADKHPYEFTIRSHRDNGSTTELSKMVDGWGDWMFYGHADKSDVIWLWWLINLKSWRAALIRDAAAPEGNRTIKKGEKSNGDGTSFAWFDLRSFPVRPPILIASSRPILSISSKAA